MGCFCFSHTLEVPGPLRSLEIGKESMCKAWKLYHFYDGSFGTTPVERRFPLKFGVVQQELPNIILKNYYGYLKLQ